MDAYCVKCKKKREMEDAQHITTKNGRAAVTGTCPVCNSKMYTFVSGGILHKAKELIDKI
jgi:hypothetical protein